MTIPLTKGTPMSDDALLLREQIRTVVVAGEVNNLKVEYTGGCWNRAVCDLWIEGTQLTVVYDFNDVDNSINPVIVDWWPV